MACRVFRSLKLGRIHDQPSTVGPSANVTTVRFANSDSDSQGNTHASDQVCGLLFTLLRSRVWLICVESGFVVLVKTVAPKTESG